MTRKILRLGAGAAVLVVMMGAAAPAYAFAVYRGVAADAEGVVNWTRQNFGVSGQPNPTLSFFHFDTDQAARDGLDAQCFIKVELPGVQDNPPVNTQAQVGIADIPVNGLVADQPRDFPWTIVFDNIDPGHWSIARDQITNLANNTAASRVAAAGFQSLANTANSNVTVIHGSLAVCSAAAN